MKKGDSFTLQMVQVRLSTGSCSLMFAKKKKSSPSDPKEAFCLNTLQHTSLQFVADSKGNTHCICEKRIMMKVNDFKKMRAEAQGPAAVLALGRALCCCSAVVSPAIR